jgi:hypothetical protein
MRYDKNSGIYGTDGQPRVSFSGLTWVRYITDFVDGSKVTLHIWSDQKTHEAAEAQLSRFYGLFQEKDGLGPLEVFRKYW